MLEGGSVAVTGDDSVTSNKAVREMEARVRELERQLGRKTLEVEILKEALDKSRSKNRPCLRSRSNRAVPDEGGGTDVRRIPFELAGTTERKHGAASELL